MKAIAFYDKRNNTMYPTKSDLTRSWASETYSRPQSVNAGMGSKKPLIAVKRFIYFLQYNPNNSRNLLSIPDYIPPYPNSSQVYIGQRNKKDVKHYITSYGNSTSFIHESKRIPTSHPGIQAFRNKWIKSRM